MFADNEFLRKQQVLWFPDENKKIEVIAPH
jgi:hypothetical protein